MHVHDMHMRHVHEHVLDRHVSQFFAHLACGAQTDNNCVATDKKVKPLTLIPLHTSYTTQFSRLSCNGAMATRALRGVEETARYGEKGLELRGGRRRWWLWLSDLCERWRAEQKRCRRVHAAQRLSRDHSPSRSPSRSRSHVAAAPNSKAALVFTSCRVG